MTIIITKLWKLEQQQQRAFESVRRERRFSKIILTVIFKIFQVRNY